MSGGSKSPSNPSNLSENYSKSSNSNDFLLGSGDFPSLIISKDVVEKRVSENPRISNWRSALMEDKGNSVDPSTGKLPYHKPQTINGKKISIISATDLVDELRVCDKFLVGYFVGRKLPFLKVKEALGKAWNLKGDFRMSLHEDSMFIFEFDLDEDRSSALELGYVFVLSSLFLIRPWQLFIEQDIKEMKTIHVWLKLRNIPSHLWNAKGIGMITSVIGVPLFADKHTLARTRMSYARACVEMEANSDFPEFIPVSYDGKEFKVSVEYSWKPPRCLSCSSFGHTNAKCPKEITKKKIWIPKNKAVVETVVPQEKGNEVVNTEGYDASVVVGVNLQGSEEVVSAGDEASLVVQDKNTENNFPVQSDLVPSMEIAVVPLVETVVNKPAEGQWTVYSSRKNRKKQNKLSETPTSGHDDQVIGVTIENGSDNLGHRNEEIEKSSNGEEDIPSCSLQVIFGKRFHENVLEGSVDAREESCEDEDASEMSEYETDVEELPNQKIKPLGEIRRKSPTKEQHMAKLMDGLSSLVKPPSSSREMELKKIFGDITDRYKGTKADKDLGPCDEKLGRGKRTPAKKNT